MCGQITKVPLKVVARCASGLANVPRVAAKDATSAARPESALNAVAAVASTMETMTMCEDQNATSQTTRYLSSRDTIAQAVEVVCSDGNSDCFRVADDVIRALHRQGFEIVGASTLEHGLDHCA